jgi:predicted RNase H-like nuclease (RuvC/YqgF family)
MRFRINESDSSAPGLLLYLTLLSFVGGSLGMYAKTRLNNSSNKAELSEDFAMAREQLERLQTQVKQERDKQEKRHAHASAQERELTLLEQKWQTAATTCEKLRDDRVSLRQAIDAATSGCTQQLARYREITWKAAAGEVHAEIKTLQGKIYRNVTIKRVSAEGVEISHDGGPGRLAPEVLDRRWHDRFQWKNPPP